LNVQLKGQSLRRISISVGLAMYPDHANNGNDLIRLADAALYEAKHAGRNQVQLAVGALTI